MRGDRKTEAGATAMRALDCLEDVALEKGLDGLSMRDVAKRVGISLASLQYHYPSKAALIDAFIQRTIRQFRDGIDEILHSKDQDRLAALVRYCIEETLKSAEGDLFAMIEVRALHDSAAATSMADFMQAYLEGLRDVVMAETPDITRAQAALAAALIAAMIEGLSTTHEAADGLGVSIEALSSAALEAAPDLVRLSMRVGAG